ncbi:MAG: TRAP transporter fused permease subunit [Reyranella sp.]|uniref:TRAP transporter fused permease subunit n=1 Tax=Reyranella sp. TaxID=1929291 RepID=UPI001212D02F|nr:TRAP transporter fused permease subunit [Reyranella sp.]TAJ37558.1 MAG: TRAP transporter fused permease subunit [Reyranella sp.]
MTDRATPIVFDDPHQVGPAEAETMRLRTLSGAWRWALVVLTGVTIFLCINQQFALRFFVGFTQLNTEYFYLLISCMLPFTFLIFPGSPNASMTRLPWYDIVLFASTALASLYLMLHIREAAELGWEFGDPPQSIIWAGYVMWAVLMEALRRTGGWSLMLCVLPFTVYPLFAGADWLGPLRGNQSTLDQTTAYHVLSTESLLGIPIQAFADVVIGFLVFGTALMMTGAGKFFINLAFALCGTFRGGAAKVGIFASGLLGMMSGSIVSNVLTAGTMTIPTMKRTGFTASYAAAIEACASTGAVLAPPVMGATAFVMAQFMGTTYAEVAVAAIIPAILYYAGLFMQVDAYAARKGLKGLERRELPSLGQTFKEGWYFAFVVIVLVVMLLYFKRESHAPFYATALLLVLNQWEQPGKWKSINTIALLIAVTATAVMTIRGEAYAKAIELPAGDPGLFDAWMNAVLLPALGGMLLLVVLNELGGEKRWGLAKYVKFLEANGRTFVELVGILAGCGLLIGAFSLTGVISSLANDLLALAGGNALLLLVMCAITSLVLGLGLTTTACYIFLAILVGPALEKLGLNKMAVHMFIFYWGMLSSITPPVAIASFAAAGIAGAPAMKTGWESMWVGSIIYFIPFFFVMNPALVLQASAPGEAIPYFEAFYLTATTLFGTVFICGGIQGYQAGVGDLRAAGPFEWPLRVLLILGGLVMATPGGGLMPVSNTTMELLALAILVPTVIAALLLVRRFRAA